MVAPIHPTMKAKLLEQAGVSEAELEEYQRLLEERSYAPRGREPGFASPIAERRTARLRELADRINPAFRRLAG
jgi:hypothetical protein